MSHHTAAKRPLSARKAVSLVAKTVGIIVCVGFFLLPAYWMITTAFDAYAATRGAQLVPTKWTTEHFRTVFGSGFGRFMLNSILVALVTVTISGLVGLFAATGVARFRFRGRTTMLVLILIAQMVPLEALVIPLFLQARNLGMLNSLLGLAVVYLAFTLPFGVWMLRGFVAAVPKEVEEAAFVDGANWFQMFWRILFPLVAPGLVATSVFSFITAWDEFIFALTFLQNQQKYTVAIGLNRFFGQHLADWGPIMAASTLITIPIIIFFVLVQRNLISGMSAGAVKG